MARYDYKQDFETLTVGELDGQDSWVKSSGSLNVYSGGAVPAYDGLRAVSSMGALSYYTRTVDAADKGTFEFAVRGNSYISSVDIYLYDEANENSFIDLFYSTSSGKFQLYDSVLSDWVDVASFVVDTWFFFEIQFDVTTGICRARANGGAWSADVNFTYVPSAPSVDTIGIDARSTDALQAAVFVDTFNDGSASSSFSQGTQLVGAETTGEVQAMNTGKSDDGDPIYFEIETQEIDFGNRAHLKKIADQVSVNIEKGDDTSIEAKTDSRDYKPIPFPVDRTVTIGEKVNLEGHFFTFKWSGESAKASPVFKGIYIEKITDLGITNG